MEKLLHLVGDLYELYDDARTCKLYISKNNQILNFMKSRSAGAELFHADGGTDMKVTVAVHNFANEPCDEMQTLSR